jgi:Rod binding domain-containing protein
MHAVILPPSGPPDAKALSNPDVAKAWHAAQDFEAMTLGEMLKPMFDTVDTSKGKFGGGDGEATWRPMLTQAMAKQMAAHGGVGIAVPVFQQMLRMQEAATETPA